MINMRKLSLLLLIIGFLFVGSMSVKAVEYSYTFTTTTFHDSEMLALNDVDWTLVNNGNYYGYDGTKGQQIGSGANPATSAILSTSGITGYITSITINVSGANGINATFAVSVNDKPFTCSGETSVSLTNSATAYTFTGGQQGEIKLSFAQTSSVALYIKSISVTYFPLVTSIAAFKSLAAETEAALSFSDAADARVTYVRSNSQEVFLRDNSGAICLYNITSPSRSWAYNQHVAGTLIGKYTLDNGLPELQATANTNTDNLIIADRVSEDMVMPKKIDASDYDANLADWVRVEDLVVGTSDINAYNRYTPSYYQTPHEGARIDLSGIAYPDNSTKRIAVIYQNSVRPLVYVIDENEPFVSPASDIQNATVRLVRTLSSEYWNTFAVPFNFSFDETEALIREYDNISGTTMLFKEAESIEAGKPYLIIPDETIANPVFYDVTLSATPAQTVTHGAYSFVAIYSPYAMALDQTELYLGDGDLLYYPVNNTSNSMRGMRAFYRVPIGGAKVAIYGEDYEEEETDGIRSIENSELRIDNYDYYNLSGQRVGKDYKGIVIKNGKKYIIK